ncbi:NAD/NADP octopine/nopaline dehydrogenase family protein [Devosia sp. A369]
MRVAILGAGAIGFASAAYLMERGHQVALWSPSGRSTLALKQQALHCEGLVEGEYRPEIAADIASAISGATAILIALPANGHRMVYDALAESVSPGQTIIINAHPALGGFHLLQQLEAAQLQVPVVAWGTTLLRARRVGETGVRINTIRKRIDVATAPANDIGAISLCRELFGDHFEPRANLLAISLSNLNPQSHLALALTNFTRMERGEAWGQSENLTPSVARLMDALDRERLAIADALGLSVRTAAEHYHLSYNIPLAPLPEMADTIRAMGPGQLGPTKADSRYVLEDAPFGLMPLVRLGEAVGVPPVLHRAGLDLLSALYARDFAAENDLKLDMASLGILK